MPSSILLMISAPWLSRCRGPTLFRMYASNPLLPTTCPLAEYHESRMMYAGLRSRRGATCMPCLAGGRLGGCCAEGPAEVTPPVSAAAAGAGAGPVPPCPARRLDPACALIVRPSRMRSCRRAMTFALRRFCASCGAGTCRVAPPPPPGKCRGGCAHGLLAAARPPDRPLPEGPAGRRPRIFIGA